MRPAEHQKQQVSLRGASAKEISRDALLEKVVHERELRSYVKKATAAAITIQKVWRGHCSVVAAAEKIRTEWKAQLESILNTNFTSQQISVDIVRPFLFFICRLPLSLHSGDVHDDNQCIQRCFRIVLQSINSSDPKYNFCSLALGPPEDRARWFCQTCNMFSICALILSKDAQSLTIALAMRLMVSLTDINIWNNSLKESKDHASTMIWKLCNWIASRKGGLYSSVRDYLFSCNIPLEGANKTVHGRGDNFIITASAITMVLRPFLILQSDDHLNDFELCNAGLKCAAKNFCIYILTIPCLAKRLPAALLPALKHSSILSPCLKTMLISKETVFQPMAELDRLNSSGMPCAFWALANTVNLASELSECSEYSGEFVSGLDCKDYVFAVSNILGEVMPWIEGKKQSRKREDEEKEIDIRNYLSGGWKDHIPTVGKDEENCSLQLPLVPFMDSLRPLQKQWHLRQLISVVEKEDCEHGLGEEASTMKLELQDVAKLYSELLTAFSNLDLYGCVLAFLNILAFTKGFLLKLWNWLERKLMIKHDVSSASGKPHETSMLSLENKFNTSGGTQENVTKSISSKWTSVLQRMKGKTSCEPNDKVLSMGNVHEDYALKDDAYMVWEVESMKRGPLGVSKDTLTVLHVFCSAYAHLLIVIDDEEFYEKQVPFTLEQQRIIASVLNTMVYNGYLTNSMHPRSCVIDAAIRCLYFLYERDCRRNFCPSSLWLAPAVNYRPPIAMAARAYEAMSTHMKLGDSSVGATIGSLITTIPHVFPFEERVQMFREFVKADKAARRMTGELLGPGPGSIEIAVHRNHIVEDGFAQLNSLGAKLKSCLNVSFVNEHGLPEAGLDYGGLFKEFLTDLAKAAFDPHFGLFMQTSTEERLLFPHPLARFLSNGIPMIEFLGRIVGKALYEGILLDYSFSHVFVWKLLGRYSFLDELSSVDPELHRNLMYLKHYEGDVRDLALDFTVTEEIFGKRVVIELLQGGSSIPVTNENKLQYVHAMADYKLNRQIQPLINAFNKGLTDLISPSWLSLFNARELNQLLSGGEHDFDVDDLRANTQYTGGYSGSSQTVKLFWKVVREFEPAERCALLKFVTSCSRAPLLGFKHLQPAFTIHKVACDTPFWAMIGGQDVERLPSASTCYNTLKLPTYKRQTTLKSKLLYAIKANAGFELS